MHEGDEEHPAHLVTTAHWYDELDKALTPGISRKLHPPTSAMASQCLGVDGVYLPSVKPLPAERSSAWRAADKSCFSPQRFHDGTSDPDTIKDPCVFQILSSEHVKRSTTVDESIIAAFRSHRRKNRALLENALNSKYDLAAGPRTHEQSTERSFPTLLNLPQEFLDAIVENSLEYRFRLVAWLDKPPMGGSSTTDEGVV